MIYKVGVQFEGQPYQSYKVDVNITFGEIIDLVRAELPKASRILVLVPGKYMMVEKEAA